MLSDHIIVLGNDFTKSTYTRFDDDCEEVLDRFSNLNCFFYRSADIAIEKRDYSKARKHIVWFGSAGCLHKGLDIAIEFALRHPEYTLHICGASHHEKEFWSYFDPILHKAENIIDHGFLNIKSEGFSSLMMRCSFAIFPSVSEGGGAALLTCMGNAGLVPLTSVRTGLDLPEYIPVLAEDKNVLPEYEKLIKEWEFVPDEKLKEISMKLKQYVCNTYSYEKYKANLKRIISEAMQQ